MLHHVVLCCVCVYVCVFAYIAIAERACLSRKGEREGGKGRDEPKVERGTASNENMWGVFEEKGGGEKYRVWHIAVLYTAE